MNFILARIVNLSQRIKWDTLTIYQAMQHLIITLKLTLGARVKGRLDVNDAQFWRFGIQIEDFGL